MSKSGFSALVEKGMKEEVLFGRTTGAPQKKTRIQIMMLQLVLRAAQSDSQALRRILKILRETRPSKGKATFLIFELDEHDQVVNRLPSGKTRILGSRSMFPSLPKVGGPVRISKDELKPVRPKKIMRSRQSNRPGRA